MIARGSSAELPPHVQRFKSKMFLSYSRAADHWDDEMTVPQNITSMIIRGIITPSAFRGVPGRDLENVLKGSAEFLSETVFALITERRIRDLMHFFSIDTIKSVALERSPSVNEMLQMTLFMMAIEHDWPDLAACILENRKFDINNFAMMGHSLLTASCISKRFEITELLLRSGANPSLFDFYSMNTLFHLVSKSDDIAHVRLLDRFIRSMSAEDVLKTKEDGNNILHIACEKNHHNIVEYLVKCGKGDELLKQQNKMGMTPLHWSVHHGRTHCLVSILNLDWRRLMDADSHGNNIFHLVALSQGGEYLKIGELANKALKENGCSKDLINSKSALGKTALHIAAMKESPSYEVCRALIRWGADVRVRSDAGLRPVDMLSISSDARIKPLLLPLRIIRPLDRREELIHEVRWNESEGALGGAAGGGGAHRGGFVAVESAPDLGGDPTTDSPVHGSSSWVARVHDGSMKSSSHLGGTRG